ncbi:MAG: dihydroorotate dehydrogenase [Bradymonadia bacterium]|jgi:dihydroorotate dehydrogenase
MYGWVRPLLFRLDPETAHGLGTRAMDLGLLRFKRPVVAPRMLFGHRFDNPVGIAAGFDKNAAHVRGLARLGFGFIEIGSVTAQPSAGNAKPRLFRLPADEALINRMGLNNAGAEAVAQRLATVERPVPIFVNVAKSHDSSLSGRAGIDDYVRSVTLLAPHADVLVLNVSCPNSGDGRTFEHPDALAPLLEAVMAAKGDVPMLIKLSPDLPEGVLDAAVDLSIEAGAAGFTVANTTVKRAGLKTPAARLDAIGKGGLSGAPLFERTIARVAHVRSRILRSRTTLPIVAVGGIATGAQAQAALDAGADLVQIYTGFVYGGPKTVLRMCAGLQA